MLADAPCHSESQPLARHCYTSSDAKAYQLGSYHGVIIDAALHATSINQLKWCRGHLSSLRRLTVPDTRTLEYKPPCNLSSR